MNPDSLLQQVQVTIQRYGLLNAQDPRPVVVGLSGGADSWTLAHALARLGFPLVVAHLDHGLRPESAAQARAVQTAARAQGWPVVLARARVRDRARTERLSLEDAARRERYAFLFRVAQERDAQAVAVGHTLDDQAETVLLRLLRGAGVEGLRAMQPRTVPTPWHSTIPLVRPLLEVRRAATQAYAQTHDLPIQPDSSNQDLGFVRNWIRHELLPRMARVNPRVVETLARTAQALAADAEVLAAAEADAWAQTVAETTDRFVRLRPQAWNRLLPGLRYRVLRRAARHLRGGPFWWHPSWEQVRAADQVLRQRAAPLPRAWVGGLYLLTRPDGLFLLRGAHIPPGPWPQLPAATSRSLHPGQRLELAHGWRLEASPPLPASSIRAAWQTHPLGPWEAWLDPDAAPPPWQVAPPRAGERFAPLGLDGHTLTVGDAFTNRKIPRSLRARWPLLRDATGRIVWFPGYGPSHHARLTSHSRRAVHVRLIPPAEQSP